jgi:hypothetical protein
MKKITYSTEEKKIWTKYFTKYFQIKSKNGRSKLPQDVYESLDFYYTKYVELQEIKKSIINQLNERR